MASGLTAGLLLFGTAGALIGRATAPDPPPPPTPALGVFEQSQKSLNQPLFAGTALTRIAEGWLPFLSTCARSGTPGGPALAAGEKARVRCTLNGMSTIFVEYNSTAERDQARERTATRNADADAGALAPGIGPAGRRAAPSGRTDGDYVEYAYRLTEQGVARTVSGIWWDDTASPVAGYLLAYWEDGVGESWDPMRDLWARYA